MDFVRGLHFITHSLALALAHRPAYRYRPRPGTAARDNTNVEPTAAGCWPGVAGHADPCSQETQPSDAGVPRGRPRGQQCRTLSIG